MTTYQQPHSSEQLQSGHASNSPDTCTVNCVVSIITDDDSDVDTLKDTGPYDDRRGSAGSYVFSYGNSSSIARSKPPLIKHIASSSSVCTMDTESRAGAGGGLSPAGNCLVSQSSSASQLNGAGYPNGKSTLGGRPYLGSSGGGNNSGCAPILLSVPGASAPRRRHSWICG